MKNGKANGNDGKPGNDENHKSHSFHKIHPPPPPDANRVLPPRGDYQTLLSFQKAEIKLTSVGRASLEELLADYRDYLRVRDLRQWDKDSKEALFVRELGRQTPQTFEVYREFVETRPAEVIANIAICLIHQTNYLLDQQLKIICWTNS